MSDRVKQLYEKLTKKYDQKYRKERKEYRRTWCDIKVELNMMQLRSLDQ